MRPNSFRVFGAVLTLWPAAGGGSGGPGSRPAFSSAGRTAVDGRREPVFLTRAGPGQPWTIALELLVDAF